MCLFSVNCLLKMFFHLYLCSIGTSVTRVTATDADDPVYGNSAKLVYSILEGQPYFSIDQTTGKWLLQLRCHKKKSTRNVQMVTSPTSYCYAYSWLEKCVKIKRCEINAPTCAKKSFSRSLVYHHHHHHHRYWRLKINIRERLNERDHFT